MCFRRHSAGLCVRTSRGGGGLVPQATCHVRIATCHVRIASSTPQPPRARSRPLPGHHRTESATPSLRCASFIHHAPPPAHHAPAGRTPRPHAARQKKKQGPPRSLARLSATLARFETPVCVFPSSLASDLCAHLRIAVRVINAPTASRSVPPSTRIPPPPPSLRCASFIHHIRPLAPHTPGR